MKTRKILNVTALVIVGSILFIAAAFPQDVHTAALELANTFQELNTFLSGIAIGPGGGQITFNAPAGVTPYTLEPPPTAGSANAALCNSTTPGQLAWGGCSINNLSGVTVSGTAASGYTIVASSSSAASWQPSVTLSEATTGSLGGSALSAGQCSSTTVSISAAAVGDKVNATPSTYPGDGFYWYAYVSGSGTVTVEVCAVLGGTPTASVYNVGDWP
jgi:hypothetical protein